MVANVINWPTIGLGVYIRLQEWIENYSFFRIKNIFRIAALLIEQVNELPLTKNRKTESRGEVSRRVAMFGYNSKGSPWKLITLT